MHIGVLPSPHLRRPRAQLLKGPRLRLLQPLAGIGMCPCYVGSFPLTSHLTQKETMGKCYFPAPGFDCSPDGPIALGSILADALSPETPLNDKPIPLDNETIRDHFQYGVNLRIQRSRKGSGGIFANIFENIGLRIAGTGAKSMHTFAKFEKLQTSSFEPTDDYMRESLSTPKVQQYLARHYLRKRVFIITGVKSAFGAEVTSGESTLAGAHVSLGLDGNVIGVPLSVGPQAEGSRGSSQTMSFKQATPFVFAYRLREIRYRAGVPTDRPYQDGALYTIGGNKDKDTVAIGDETPSQTAVFVSIDEEDLTGEDVDLNSVYVPEDEGNSEAENDDNDICELIVL